MRHKDGQAGHQVMVTSKAVVCWRDRDCGGGHRRLSCRRRRTRGRRQQSARGPYATALWRLREPQATGGAGEAVCGREESGIGGAARGEGGAGAGAGGIGIAGIG
eukprot:scaffold891_cov90-Isochrysis_galbana.AAC.1